jgi:hypothetical protein
LEQVVIGDACDVVERRVGARMGRPCRALGRFGSNLGTVRVTAEIDREAGADEDGGDGDGAGDDRRLVAGDRAA